MAIYGQAADLRQGSHGRILRHVAFGVLALFALPAEAFQGKVETTEPLIEQARILADEDRDEAEALYVHILELREHTLGAEDQSTLMAALELARFYRDNGRWADAEPLFRRAITGLARILDTDDPIMVSAEQEFAELTGDDDSSTVRNVPSTAIAEPRRVRSRARTGAMRPAPPLPAPSPPPPAPSPPPPPVLASPAPPSPARSGIPVYPVWPPESPTWQFSLDRYIGSRDGLSLSSAGSRLQAAFESAGYLEHSYYAVPGGFAIITRIEQMDSAGNRLRGSERYELPGQRARDSLTNILYSLFVNAPPGYYRYIVVVVSVRPFATRNTALDDDEALRRLRRGANRLSSAYRRVPFTDDYNVDALIYEFRWDGGDSPVRMLAPGRVSPQEHLTRTGLARAVRRGFP